MATSASHLTTSTRAIGMADFKLPLLSENTKKGDKEDVRCNYFLSKPDIWVYTMQKSDEIIMIGNSTVFERMSAFNMVNTELIN